MFEGWRVQLNFWAWIGTVKQEIKIIFFYYSQYDIQKQANIATASISWFETNTRKEGAWRKTAHSFWNPKQIQADDERWLQNLKNARQLYSKIWREKLWYAEWCKTKLSPYFPVYIKW